MDPDLPLLTGLEGRIAASVAPTLADMGYELVRVAVLGREVPTVQIMADRADGSLIGVEDCERISHAVGAVLDVDDPIPGAWTLEVSSAGIDRPLTREKDWNRFSGHLAKAETNFPVDGRKRFSGIVLGAADGQGRLRLDDGGEVALPLAELRRARLVLTDALIEASAQMMGVPAVVEGDAPGDAPGEGAAEAPTDAPASRGAMLQADGRPGSRKVGGARVGGSRTGAGGGAGTRGRRKPH
ncbi:ribosome maturation factor RimP [Rhizosaccharibacter radicis]|uniref:Ribosome maturation factor RimP n=1 Tax=Rhizosaccharibacter radicis TaxID=2782605 RepID=A0ABT1VYT6_9PROT|nr:ribosome maturation factor RimP [Acetobacteraceae bacterium KSS12]